MKLPLPLLARSPFWLAVGLIFFFSLPPITLAVDEPDTSSCDTGTIACSCPPAVDSSEASLQALDTADGCWSMCTTLEQSITYSSTDITGYALTCQVSGVTTALAQGSIGLAGTDVGEAVVDTYYAAPELGIQIPGLTFSEGSKNGSQIETNYLAEYVNAVYTWLLSAAALVAVIMLMIAGMQYVLARGDSGKIGAAVKRIEMAIVGLVLLFGGYTIAYTIDPNQTRFSSLKVSYVDKTIYELPQPDLPGDVDLTSASSYATSQGILPGDILCGGSTVADIAASAVGKVTYRYGAKGGPPPYTAETKSDSSGIPYSSYCPDGTVCYDCSGFANYMGQCAGLASAGETGGTSEIFSTSEGAEVISSIDTSSNSINGIALVAGDMVGAPSDHVMTYIGNGEIADSHADRDPGEAIGIYPLSYFGTEVMTGRDALYVRRR